MNAFVKTLYREFFRVNPVAGAHRVALRAALCLAFPLFILYLTDRADLAMYASFGAFTGVYGRNEGYGYRFAMQAMAGTTIVVTMLIGTLLSYLELPDAIRVLVTAFIAAIVALIAFGFTWRPTGGLFMVFAAGACATIPASEASFGYVVIVAGGTVLFSLFVTAALALRRIPPARLFIRPTLEKFKQKFIASAVMTFVASLLAGWAGLLIFGDHWYWAMVAAIAVLVGRDIHAQLTRGLQRFLGTVAGVGLAAFVMWLDPPILMVFIIAVFLQGLIEFIVMRNYAAAMIFITAIALLMVNLASPLPPETLINNRVMETLVGVIVGMMVTVAAQFVDIE